jgi:hypothetical protein
MGMTTSDENINELFEATKRQLSDPEKIAKLEELIKVSPAAALTNIMMDSGQDPYEFLKSNNITLSDPDNPSMAEVLKMSPEELAKLPPKPRDPKHPDRPSHPHFYALAEAVRSNDGYADSGVDLEEIFGMAQFDYRSVLYMAQQRSMRWLSQTTEPENDDQAVAHLTALWIDAFLAGLKVGDGRSTPLPNEVDVVLAKVEDGQHRGRQL